MLTRKAASTTLVPGQSAAMISSFVTKRWGFRTRKSSTAKVLCLRKIFSVPRRRDRFGVSRTKGLNRSRVSLPICPHCGTRRGVPSFTEILRSHYCHRCPVRVNHRGAYEETAISSAANRPKSKDCHWSDLNCQSNVVERRDDKSLRR